ncbi:hypothetical protein C3489_21985 [Streptomyces sp. Ru71]|nr:hypothetical protein C3489_21985 [Streptomyces sp. Ru71]
MWWSREGTPHGNDGAEGDVFHRSGGSTPWSQPLFRFPGPTAVGPSATASYLGMTAVPESAAPGGDVKNRWRTLVRTVKIRHSAYTPEYRAQGCWQVRTARSVG